MQIVSDPDCTCVVCADDLPPPRYAFEALLFIIADSRVIGVTRQIDDTNSTFFDDVLLPPGEYMLAPFMCSRRFAPSGQRAQSSTRVDLIEPSAGDNVKMTKRFR